MTTKATPFLRRALLYVPASSPKFLQKSLSLTVDTITYDLEDSVTPSQKPQARKTLQQFLTSTPKPPSISELSVRINAVSTGLALEDLTSILQSPHLDTIVVPKVNRASDLTFITDILRHRLPDRHPSTPSPSQPTNPINILALIESAESLTNLSSICAASPYLKGLIFAAEDFALDLSLTRTPSLTEFLYARSSIVTHARAFSLPSTIDLVCTSYLPPLGPSTLESECLQGKGLGFNGKQCIHPSQISIIQETFAPGREEVEWSIRIVIADEKADVKGRGAWTLEGKMIDVPVVRKAQATVERAKACGIDIDELREKWKGQEPE